MLADRKKQETVVYLENIRGNVFQRVVEKIEKVRDYLPFTVLIMSLICREKAELDSTVCSILRTE